MCFINPIDLYKRIYRLKMLNEEATTKITTSKKVIKKISSTMKVDNFLLH